MEAKTETLEQLTKNVAKGGSIFFAGSLFGRVINFVLHILLARVLGASSYGLYTLGYSIITIASQFSILGLQNGIVRFVSLYRGIGDTKRVKGTLISAFAGATVFSIAIGISLFIFSNSISVGLFSKPNLSNVLRIFSISLTFYVLMIMASYSARAFKAMQYDVGVSNICFPILNVISVALAFLLGFKLLGAIYAFLISASLSAFLGFYFIKRISPEVFTELSPSYEFRKLLRFSLPVCLIGFSYVILIHIDRIMIGYFMNSSDVGIYNTATQIAMLSQLILNSIGATFSPFISELYNRNKLEELGYLFKTCARWIFALTLPLIVIMIMFSREILDLLFGARFAGGWTVLVILPIARLIPASTGSVGSMLQMSGNQDLELINTIVTVIMNIGLNIWLVPAYGIPGAALATGISIGAINVVKLIEVYKLIGVQPYNRKYIKPVISGMLATIVCLICNNLVNKLRWTINMTFFLAIYFITLYCFGLAEEENIVIAALKKKLGIGVQNET